MTGHETVSRRDFLLGVGASGTLALSGCIQRRSDYDGGGDDGPLSGSIAIAGSSTVFPLTEAMRVEFLEEYPNVDISLQSTGTILSLGRAVGETATLIMVGLAPIGGVPDSLAGQGTALPLQVFAWALDARRLFRENVAAAGSMTLLILLLSMNAVAIIIRNKYRRDQ